MKSFFTVGGTLKSDAPSYVARAADRSLLEALRRGDFAYVLDSRQKGKSSLMIRTRESLAAAGVRTVLLDLQRFGSNLGPEQWYGSMLLAAGQELDREDRLLELWDAQGQAGPMQRFFAALEGVAAEMDEQLVIFVDEIDFVRSLPFSTDEFFAGIRETFNRRAAGAAPNLTFCLLGVATPSELIRDVQITPFNVGTRIDLTDFTLAELAPFEAALSEGGRDGRALVRRIHHWTAGHPYLTQKLAAAVAADLAVRNSGGVDRLVEAMFFSVKARAEEPNLTDVSRRVLEAPVEGVNPEEARSRVLDLYRQVRDGKRVRDDETDPVLTVLKLSGLTRILEGYLVVRNRVYFRAFDRAWVEANLPDAERVRQKRAAKAAATRVGLIAGGVALAVGALAIFGLVQAGQAQLASAKAQSLAMSERSAREDAEKAGELAARRAREAEAANARTTQALATAQEERKRADAKAQEARQATEKTEAALAQATEARRIADSRAAEARRATEQTRIALAQVTREKNRAENERKTAVEQKTRADTLAKQEAATAERERLARQATNRLLYQANMNLVQTAFENDQFARVQELLNESAKPEYAAFRGPEWGYWRALTNTHLFELQGQRFGRSSPFSPDGTQLVTSSQDNTARIWDTRRGHEIAKLNGHTGTVMSAVFSLDGRRVVTASADGTARIWSAHSGLEIAALRGHNGPVNSAAFSPDGSRVITESGDGSARVWDANIGREVAVLRGHKDRITSAIFSSDSKRVLTASWDGTVQVWDPNDGREPTVLEEHANRVNGASFSPDGTKVLTFSIDGTARIWDVRNGLKIGDFRGHDGPVHDAAFSPDGARLVTAGRDGTVRIWNAGGNKQIALLRRNQAPVNSASFSPDGSRIVTASVNGTVCIWDAYEFRIVAELEHEGEVSNAVFSPDGRSVVTREFSARLDSVFPTETTVRYWDARAGRKSLRHHWGDAQGSVGRFSPCGERLIVPSANSSAIILEALSGRTTAVLEGFQGSLFRATFSPDGKRIILPRFGNLAIWDTRSGLMTNAFGNSSASGVSSAIFSSDGEWLLTTNRTNLVTLWKPDEGQAVLTLKGHTDSVDFATFSSDGERIVSASRDRTARVWNTRDGQLISILTGHVSRVNTASFSLDGKRVVTASMDGTARVWGVLDGREIAVLGSAKDNVSNAVFAPSGAFIVAVTWDNKARIWSAIDGRKLAVLNGHDDSIVSASFSQDSTRVLTASVDGTVRLWDPQNGREILRIGVPGIRAARLSPDGNYIFVSADRYAEVIPLSPEAAAKLTFVREEEFVATQMAQSAAAGNLFAWNWQVKHWLTPEIAATPEAQAMFEVAQRSPNPEIAADARRRLRKPPQAAQPSRLPLLGASGVTPLGLSSSSFAPRGGTVPPSFPSIHVLTFLRNVESWPTHLSVGHTAWPPVSFEDFLSP